jgi:hypothetical protein
MAFGSVQKRFEPLRSQNVCVQTHWHSSKESKKLKTLCLFTIIIIEGVNKHDQQ